ncbi:hypothetical protein AMS59_00565 [Lysinibacillus sp. FJAT-14745]|uniref:RNA polymerase sigma-70 factor n=1 Tax=Lysinibacillus sp. FJAT-14745 TaxID=1704289 RepID=UPI0006ABCB4C|nr:RNA polymerase sigma-70 factor [Lysinibacillus sp. FJAT-14745]KOP80975.1 hypothetical protein AMS59_00565 [Lysinibacillus sp. FJAT-14745]
MDNELISQLYKEHKSLLFSIAYRMTGSASDAEDIVQDVFTRIGKTEVKHMNNIKALLCKMVTNRCLDLLKSSRKKRELYTGTWLPEPLALDEDDPLFTVLNDTSISLAIMILFEELNPIERAIFILREVFEYEYPTIAEIVEKSEINCRKILSRIKKKLPELVRKNSIVTNKLEIQNTVTVFMSAFQQGKVDQLVHILKEDVAYYADGGGKVTAALHPIYGREKVFRLLSALFRKFENNDEIYQLELMNVNGTTGLALISENKIQAVIGFEVEHGQIEAIYYMVNPDKLRCVC